MNGPHPSVLVLHTETAAQSYAVSSHSSVRDLAECGINPCSFSGLAVALRGTYRAWNGIRSFQDLAGFEVIVVVPKLSFRVGWLREARKRFPNTLFVGQYEENVRKHKLWCRSWEFQKSFYEFAQIMDVMTTFHERTRPYYELFSKRKVEYLPHPYAVDYVAGLGVRRAHQQKAKILLKAGHIHGRAGADGFADVVPLIHLLEQENGYRIQIIDYPRSTEEVLWVFDIRGRQDHRLGLVVEKLGALVEERGVVLVAFDHEVFAAADPPALTERDRHAADEQRRIATRLDQNMSDQRRRGGLAMRAGNDDRVLGIE